MKISQTPTGQQWKTFLATILTEYRAGCPDDIRSDKEILTDLMDHFVEQGLIKRENGKYFVPKLTYNA